MDPESFAYALAEHIADEQAPEDPDSYLVRVVWEVFELHPAVRERVLGDAIADLVEELHRQGDKDAARAVGEAERRIKERS